MAKKAQNGDIKDVVVRYRSGSLLRKWSVEKIGDDLYSVKHPTKGKYTYNRRTKVVGRL